ncbi:hypothetical protein DJ73_10010 [Halorubrum sp. Ea1]|uniref:right-handed parallel beta-helix repeat-containing protein n=1 Tax=Halorubrum sp. Ea1 TaxID=1480718 RepID=UPI000B98F448|nr:right-handed parallel beta-helix repeat-containing protein [Halorubrum sp. Ea1]OYR52765.1 hypothetical protein DJ73_10010 [Halorubrum sp. Ea1]
MTRARFRAVFLAAIMVLSVIAMGAGFAGSAAADSSSVVVGTNGDYQSIQTAINDEGANTTITVQDGSYDDFVVDSDNVTIKSADGVTPTISGTSDVQSYPTTVGIDANHVTVSGLNIDAGQTGVYVVAGSSDVDISHNSIEVSPGDDTYGILTGDGQTDLTISENTFTTPDGEANNHVYVNGETAGSSSSDVSVTGNAFEGSVGYAVGVDATPARVTDNNFSAVTITQDRDVAIEVFSDPDPTISGNEGALVDIVPAEGNSDTNQIYAGIQAAVDNANPGDTVEVRPGNYNENVTVNTEDLWINGPNADTPGDSDNRGTEATVEGQIGLSADSVTLSGFTVSPSVEFTPDSPTAAAIFTNSNNTAIRNNIVTGVRGDATPTGSSFSVHGVQVFKQSPERATNITISNNLIQDIDNTGGDSWQNYGGAVGVKVQNQLDDVHVEYNTIQDIHSAGWTYAVASTPSSKSSVQPVNVVIEGNTMEGIGNGSEYDVFADATAAPYPGVGIGLDTAGGEVEDDPTADASEVTAVNNDLIGAPVGVQNKDLSATLNATSNWWGSANGPTVDTNAYNNDSQGAVASGNVEFTPWLNASIEDDAQSFAPVTNDTGGQFASIQAAIDAADENDTIEVESGVYNESVDIDTQNITLSGPNADTPYHGDRQPEAVINGPVVVSASGVEVAGFTLNSTQEAEGVVLADYGGSMDTATVANNTIRAQGENANGILVQGSPGPTERVVIAGNDIRSDDAAAVNVLGSAEHSSVVITDNILRSDPAGLRDVETLVFTNNVVEDTADGNVDLEAIGSGVIADNDFETYGSGAISINVYGSNSETVANVSIVRNNFNDTDGVGIDAEGSAERVFAPLNYWGEDGTPSVRGDALYDPVLTTPYEQADTDVESIRNYGSYIELDSDGEAVAVGFSAAPDGTASEIFSELDIEGNAFTYENGEGYEEVDADDTFSAGDVVVITNNGIDEDVVVPIDTAVESEAAQPTSVEVENGWNLVATGAANDVDEIPVALGGTGSITDSAVLQAQPEQPGAPNARFGAFDGTWLLVDGSGEIATGYAEDQSPSEYYEELLLTDGPTIDVEDDDN